MDIHLSRPGDATVVAPTSVRLTPAQHARIRRHLVLMPVYSWLVMDWIDILLHLPLNLPGTHVQYARDFVQFYVPGLLADAHNRAALYDINAWPAIIARVVPGAPTLIFPPIYGPQISVFFSPLAHLSYIAALVIWMVLSTLGYLACGYAIWRVCPNLRALGGTIALLLLADPALHFSLAFGQITVIALLAFTGAFLALRAERPFLAGLAIGMLVYKPQLGVVAALVFLSTGAWRVVGGAIVGAGAQLSIGCAFWGRSVLLEYVRVLTHLLPNYRAQFEPFEYHMHSWRSFFGLLGLPASLAIALYAVVALAIAVLVVLSWRVRRTLPLQYATLLSATVLVDPHIYVYDLVILMPALLLLWDWSLGQGDRTMAEVAPLVPGNWLRRQRARSVFQTLLYCAYVSPLFGFLTLVTHVQLSVLVLTALFVGIAGALVVDLPRLRVLAFLRPR